MAQNRVVDGMAAENRNHEINSSFFMDDVWIESRYHSLSNGNICLYEVVDVFIDLKQGNISFSFQKLMVSFR